MISRYLMDNYYRYCPNSELIPTIEQIEQALSNHPDRIEIVQDEKIHGVAMYVLLSDETYNRLDCIDITNVEVIQALALEYGPNMHFMLLAADSFKTIMTGLRRAIEKHKPHTVSWWSPDFKYLHRYNLN